MQTALRGRINIRKISSGLGHSSVEITEKNYSQMIQQKILDEIKQLLASNETTHMNLTNIYF